MADKFIYHMYGLNKLYGQKHVLKNINLSFFPGAKIGIVGENGAGKTTVLKIMAGLDNEFQGEAALVQGYRAGIIMQEPLLDDSLTVRETVQSAFAETKALMDEYDRITESMAESLDDDKMQKAMDRMGELQDKLDAIDAWNLDQQIDRAGDAICLPPDDQLVGSLSGGERRRVALCKALLERPDLLLLDEPTNHLDPETVDWLEIQLREYPGTVIVVTHDRYFLDNITKWILELEGGKGVPYEGSYSSWLEQKLSRLDQAEKKDSPRSRALQRELNWIRMTPEDRRESARSRLVGYEQLIAREKAGNRGNVIEIAPGPELGDQVVSFEGVSKGFDQQALFSDLTFSLPRSAIVGLVGPNGAGKTTLFRLIEGSEQPDQGEVKVGSTVKLAHIDQTRSELDPERSLLDLVGEGLDEVILGRNSVPVRQYLSRFGFKGADQQKKVSEFSGGERNRCHLAMLLKRGGNLLLMDEPTNDLDVNTLRMLEDAILDFSGCVLVISHDRFFLDRICTHLLVFEGDEKVRFVNGNFQDYEERRRKELGTGLFENRRNRYRKLVTA